MENKSERKFWKIEGGIRQDINDYMNDFSLDICGTKQEAEICAYCVWRYRNENFCNGEGNGYLTIESEDGESEVLMDCM